MIFASLSNAIYSQNSLFLVDTLTGVSSTNRLWKAKGIGDFNGDGYADFVVSYKKYAQLYLGNPDFVNKRGVPIKFNYA